MQAYLSAMARSASVWWLPFRIALMALSTALIAINAWLVAGQITIMFDGTHIFDWWVFEVATERIGTGRMYEWGEQTEIGLEYRHRYAPLFAYVMVPFVELGIWFWRVLHVAALALLPWRLAVVVGLSFPFWWDVAQTNTMTFALVLGWRALDGSRWAACAYLGLTLLVPRPLMLPITAWILWRRTELRVPFMAVIVVYGAFTIATGELTPFALAVLHSTDAFGYPANWGPSRWLHSLWVPIGLAIGIWLFRAGRLGLASLAVAPYWIPYYFLMLFVDVRRSPAPSRLRQPGIGRK